MLSVLSEKKKHLGRQRELPRAILDNVCLWARDGECRVWRTCICVIQTHAVIYAVSCKVRPLLVRNLAIWKRCTMT